MKILSIAKYLQQISADLEHIDVELIKNKFEQSKNDTMKENEMITLLSEICVSLMTKHYNYSTIASRLLVDNMHRRITATFSETIDRIQKTLQILDPEFYRVCMENSVYLDGIVDRKKDYDIDYFGLKTLERSYLQRIDGEIIEIPQYMFLRVAVAIHKQDLESVRKAYNDMSSKYYIHATPTLFNSGLKHQQLSSCYLVAMKDDSIEGIYETLKECAQISKWAGGIGVHIHQIRGKDSKIYSNNGKSDGIVPMLRVFNDTARYCNQSGRRAGSFAIYLEPWHSDIEAFLDLKKNHGAEEERARDLFYALWIPDLFMKQVESGGDWYLMCPNECKGLSNVYGEEFEKLYWRYVEEGRYRRKMPARDLWKEILISQIETGTPYMLYKDAANRKSNQKNLGTIKSSNLCSEIILYSDKEETAVCNLASIGLPKYIQNGQFNHTLLGEKVRQIVRNLNNVIDINYYPTENCKRSNMRHRPLGIGVQGLADVFMELDLDWESDVARRVNKEIFETIYYHALVESCKISEERKWFILRYYDEILEAIEKKGQEYFRNGDLFVHKYEWNRIKERFYSANRSHYLGAYSSFEGSPISQGKFQFDLWETPIEHSGRWDWEALKASIYTYGLRNSKLLSPMPTASTSQIFGFNECIEPITSNIYSRRTLAGEFIVVNKRLMKDCIDLGIWSEEVKDKIIEKDGSIMDLEEIPQLLKEKYKTVWEMKQKTLIDMSADRGHYICHSQSLNLFLNKIDMNRLGSMHLYSWKQGLKTGIYYLRIKPLAKTQKFTIVPKVKEEEISGPVCRKEEGCVVCSS